jgi:hypothetical protein
VLEDAENGEIISDGVAGFTVGGVRGNGNSKSSDNMDKIANKLVTVPPLRTSFSKCN